jgi:hypothetical protein
LVFLVVSFLLAFPPISYMHSSPPPFVLHALPISSSFTWSFLSPIYSRFLTVEIRFMTTYVHHTCKVRVFICSVSYAFRRWPVMAETCNGNLLYSDFKFFAFDGPYYSFTVMKFTILHSTVRHRRPGNKIRNVWKTSTDEGRRHHKYTFSGFSQSYTLYSVYDVQRINI